MTKVVVEQLTGCPVCGKGYGTFHDSSCTYVNVNPITGASTWKPNTVSRNPLEDQEGGNHYKKLAIQPIEYAMLNNLNYCQSNAIKYITRYKDKGGVEDLCKAIHTINVILTMEYGTTYEECRGNK